MKKSFRAIRVASAEELQGLIDHLTHEAFRVQEHKELWDALEDSLEDYSVELHQTAAFWERTRWAHKAAVIIRLGRLFDPHEAAISLGNLLRTMRDNALDPSTPLPSAVRGLDPSELDQDMSCGRARNGCVVRSS